jgi:hypothetical protein
MEISFSGWLFSIDSIESKQVSQLKAAFGWLNKLERLCLASLLKPV